MKSIILDNGIRLNYSSNSNEISSICIGFEAGAAVEEKLGIAHAVEHMVYKGTKNRTEEQINNELSEIFAFQNAMTNYPYVIYYGSLLKEDLEKGLDIFADILINPLFSNEGFKEEMNVILQELNEWDEELEQYCEDALFYNAIEDRLKYPIIGVEDKLKLLTLDDLKDFYYNHYNPYNMVITIVSSLAFEEVLNLVKEKFLWWNNSIKYKKNLFNRNLISGKFVKSKKGISNSRVEMIFDISKLNNRELGCLTVFDEYFGKGVNSILFNELRTKAALVYDVLTNVAYEKYISFYKISFSTKEDKVEEAINIINNSINNIEKIEDLDIKKMIKRIRMKKLFEQEKSIVVAKELTTNSVMDRKIEIKDDITLKEVIRVVSSILKNPSIQIINKEDE